MKIEFSRYSSDALDEILNALVIEDWQTVKDEVKRLKRRLKDENINVSYKKTLEEDLKFNKKVKKAYETILRYCLPYERAKELLGEEKCKENGQ
jgi:rRNA-processing protein FCF1